MSRLDTAELAETVVTNRCPIHRRFHCQYEHEFYTLLAAAKHTYITNVHTNGTNNLQ